MEIRNKQKSRRGQSGELSELSWRDFISQCGESNGNINQFNCKTSEFYRTELKYENSQRRIITIKQNVPLVSGGEAATHQNFYIFAEFWGFPRTSLKSFIILAVVWYGAISFLQHYLFKTRKKSKKMKFRHRAKISELPRRRGRFDSDSCEAIEGSHASWISKFSNNIDWHRAFLYFMDAFAIYVHNCVHEHLLKAKHWQALNKMRKVGE